MMDFILIDILEFLLWPFLCNKNITFCCLINGEAEIIKESKPIEFSETERKIPEGRYLEGFRWIARDFEGYWYFIKINLKNWKKGDFTKKMSVLVVKLLEIFFYWSFMKIVYWRLRNYWNINSWLIKFALFQ